MIGWLLAAAFRRRRASAVRLLAIGDEDDREGPDQDLDPGRERTAARGGSARGFGAAVVRPREVRVRGRRGTGR